MIQIIILITIQQAIMSGMMVAIMQMIGSSERQYPVTLIVGMIETI